MNTMRRFVLLVGVVALEVLTSNAGVFIADWEVKEGEAKLGEIFPGFRRIPIRERAELCMKNLFDERVTCSMRFALLQHAMHDYIRLNDYEGALSVVLEMTNRLNVRACDILRMCQLPDDMQTPERAGRITWLDQLRAEAQNAYRAKHEMLYRESKTWYIRFLLRNGLTEIGYAPFESFKASSRYSAGTGTQLTFNYTSSGAFAGIIVFEPIKGEYDLQGSLKAGKQFIFDLMKKRDEIHQYERPEDLSCCTCWGAPGVDPEKHSEINPVVPRKHVKKKASPVAGSTEKNTDKKTRCTWNIVPRRRKIDPRLKRFRRPGEQW